MFLVERPAVGLPERRDDAPQRLDGFNPAFHAVGVPDQNIFQPGQSFESARNHCSAAPEYSFEFRFCRAPFAARIARGVIGC
jgi:hypothetical protein